MQCNPEDTISVERNIYSVPARLIGEWVDVRVNADTIEVWYGQRKEEVYPRLRGRNKHHINYRHVIGWLVRKPGAFAGYQFSGEIVSDEPLSRMAYDYLGAATAIGTGNGPRLPGILHLAARQSESRTGRGVAAFARPGGDGVSLKGQWQRWCSKDQRPAHEVMEVNVAPINLSTYDVFTEKQGGCWHEKRTRRRT